MMGGHAPDAPGITETTVSVAGTEDDVMSSQSTESGNGQTGTAVAERQPIDLDRVPPKVKEMVNRIRNAANYNTVNAQLDIMAAIQTAVSEEDIFEAATAGTMSGQKAAGRPFLLKEYDWKPSAPGYVAQGAFPWYALVKAQFLDDGKETVLDCGGFTFVSVLDALDINGHLAKYPEGYPMVLESRQMNSGFHALIPHKYQPPKAPAK